MLDIAARRNRGKGATIAGSESTRNMERGLHRLRCTAGAMMAQEEIRMVKATTKTKLTLAAVLLAAGTTFAMAQTGGGNAGGGAGGGPPNGTDANARSQVQQN